MKSELSTLEIRALVNELQIIVNARMDKIYSSSKSKLLIQLHTKEGKRFLKIDKKLIYLAVEKQETPREPSEFCKLLRKYLGNKRIKEVSQHESERIIIISTANHKLIVELFGQANIILCDNDYTVLMTSRVQTSGRVVKIKSEYKFPEKKLNTFKMKEKEFFDILKDSKTEVVKTMATLVGGTLAEEICLRASIDKNNKKLEDSEIKQLYKQFNSLLKEPVTPAVIYKNSKIKDAIPFELKIYEDFTKVAFSNFYEALDFALKESEEQVKETEAEKKYSKQIKKIESIILSQKKQLETLKKGHLENKRAGELIYENYNKVQEALDKMLLPARKKSWKR